MRKRLVILVVRQDDVFSALLRERGGEVLNLELISTAPVDDLSELREKLAKIDEYDGLFFTSPASANVFVEEAKTLTTRFTGKIYVVGHRASSVLENAGFDVTYQHSAITAEELIQALYEQEYAGKRFLFVRGNRSMRTIPETLDGKAVVDEVVVYETKDVVPDDRMVQVFRERMSEGAVDWVCFFSPSGIEAFQKIFPAELIRSLQAAAIGETTARAASRAGFRVGFVSKSATADEFAAGLLQQ